MENTYTEIYDRNELIWGKEAQEALFQKHVVVIGLGGVGSYTAEALARSGVGQLTLIDFDTASETNINRQLPALLSSIGKPKTELMKERIELINSHIKVSAINEFCTGELMSKIAGENPDFVVDAIDTLRSKVEVLQICRQRGIPVITSLGAGNRLKPEELYLADISEIDIKHCTFAKNVVYQLKKLGIEKDLPVVASHERPVKTEKRSSVIKVEQSNGDLMEFTKFSPGSSPFVPPVAGFIMASYVVRNLIKK